MTLFKQIALVVTTVLFAVLVTVTTILFNDAAASIQNRLYEDAQNTAASLSLSLGTAGGDVTTMQTMINATFDSGHFSSISLVDVDGKMLYKRTNESELSPKIPEWFHNMVKISAPTASANVSAGWQPVGILNVQSDPNFAYAELYRVLKHLVLTLVTIFIAALLFVYILLRIVLRPLAQIQKQAEAITRNEFIIQERLPRTKELKDVVIAMNKMVTKVKNMFDKANEELQKLKENEYTDKVTGLKNRKYFINKLPEYLKVDAKARHGSHIMVALNGVVEANQKIGYKKVDELFEQIAKILTREAASFEESVVARMNGTEFSILLPECNVYEALDIAKRIQMETAKKTEEFELDKDEFYAAIGIHEYTYQESVSDFLTLSDLSLSKAKLETNHLHFDNAEEIEDVITKEEWREIIKNALANDSFELVTYKVVDTRSDVVVHETITITLTTEDRVFTYGQFIAAAMQTGMVDDIYKRVLTLLFGRYSTIFERKVCSLRLSNEFLQDAATFGFVQELLAHKAKQMRFKLIVEIPDRYVTQHEENAHLYKELFARYGIEMGVFEFIGEHDDYRYLQRFRPFYIKSQQEFFLTLDIHNMRALKMLADSIDIDLIAMGVMDKASLKKLQERDIYIVQGKVTELMVE